MNKAELIDHITISADVTKAIAGKTLNAVLEAIMQSLGKGESIVLPGFGTFDVNARAARTGRNPKTGEALQIKACKVPTFRAGKALKDSVNGQKDKDKKA